MKKEIKWRRILLKFYRDELNIYKDYKRINYTKFKNLFHPAKECNLPKKVFEDSMNFLEINNLIEIRDDDFFYLTKKGFDVARDLENIKLNAILQSVIIYLTTILAFTTAVNFFASLNVFSAWVLFGGYMGSITIIAVIFYFSIFKKLIRGRN